MNPNKPLLSYLSRYAEPAPDGLASVNGRFSHCLVLPLFDETLEACQQLWRSAGAVPVLWIMVVNCPQSAVHSASGERTRDLAMQLRASLQRLKPLGDDACFGYLNDGQQAVLLVHRCEADNALPDAQGVGLARKIGFDLAVRLYQQGVLQSPWAASIDADVRLPDDYFAQLARLSQAPPSTSAAVFSFRHQPANAALAPAARRYDAWLRYYRAGLRAAHSPYGFMALGSVLAVNLVAYCQARGVPKRAAGEDFYWLNKLAKLGLVRQLQGAPLTVSARVSARVPFGTGPALNRLMQADGSAARYHFYHPDIFTALGAVHQAWLASAQRGLLPQWRDHTTGSPALHAASEVFEHMGLDQQIMAITRQYPTAQQQLHALWVWFDGFKTLKWVHGLRAQGFESLPLERLLAEHGGLDWLRRWYDALPEPLASLRND